MEKESLGEPFQIENIPGRGRHTERARRDRLTYLRKKTGAELKALEESTVPAEDLRGNIENYIGSVSVPVGLAGPLRLNHSSGTDDVFAPIATTEGALVASITRGARAISLCGGAQARFISQKMTRAPFFEFDELNTAFEFADWLRQQVPELQRLMKAFSNFSILQGLETRHLGRIVHVVFSFSTADAAGQNMTTICTNQACLWILDRIRGNFPLIRFSLEGNLSCDKKASSGATIRGRGSEVTAECILKGEVIREVLLVSARELELSLAVAKSGRIQTGMLSTNVNTANLIAGIFTATGQDIACVHESSLAELHLEAQGEDLYASIYLPNLVIGTLGGGTRFEAQKQLLQMMGCYGAGKIERFAETIAGFALALDLSTLSAMIGGQFAKSHSRLGRPRFPIGLQKNDLSPFVTRRLGATSAEPLSDFSAGDSMIMELSSQVTTKLSGFFPFRVSWANRQDDLVLMKVKPTDADIILATEMMGTMCSAHLGELLGATRGDSIFKNCHVKELEMQRLPNPVLEKLAPHVYDVWMDPKRQIFASICHLETNLQLKNAADHLEGWTPDHTREAVIGIAEFHATYYRRHKSFDDASWIGFRPTAETLVRLTPLFGEMSRLAALNFPNWYDSEIKTTIDGILERLPEWTTAMNALPKTLIHNDFNPRNLAFRTDPERRLCVFDWELATVHLPQRDLVELLAFVGVTDTEQLSSLIEAHRLRIAELTGEAVSADAWRLGCRLALQEFMINRMAMYAIAHTHRSCEFLPRTCRSALRILRFLEATTDAI